MSDTAPDKDPSSAGRATAPQAGIARMTGDALFALARNSSAQGRRALFETVQSMLFSSAAAPPDRERLLMGEILRHLVRDMELALRKKLAQRMAGRTNMPHALVVELANDDIEIASPILVDSDVLADADLVEVIRHRTAQHQLAVSRRKSLSEAVSGALVETHNEDVIMSLLCNHGAKISREVMEYLVDQSKRVDRFQGPLVERADVPTELAKRMYWWVSAALRQHIVANHALDSDALDEALEATTAETIAEHERAASSTPAEDLAARLFELGELDGLFLARALRDGEVALFEAALVQLSTLRPAVLRRVLYDFSGEALALLCKAIDLDVEIFKQIAQFVRARGAGGRIEAESEDLLVELFNRSKRSEAERVVKRWRRSSDYLKALQGVSDEQ